MKIVDLVEVKNSKGSDNENIDKLIKMVNFKLGNEM